MSNEPHPLQDLFDNLTWHEVDVSSWDDAEFFEQTRPGMVVRFACGDVHLIGDVNENAGTCGCCRITSDYDANESRIVAWADIAEFGRPIEPQPSRKNEVRLLVHVDMDDRADWGVGVVPGSGDEMPPHSVISTVLTYVAREHNENFNQGDNDDEAE